jgi:hypothetical protein
MEQAEPVKVYRFIPRQHGKDAYLAEVDALKMTWGYLLDPDRKVPSETFREVWEFDLLKFSDLERLRISESQVDAAFMALKHWRSEQLRLQETWSEAYKYWLPDLKPEYVP